MRLTQYHHRHEIKCWGLKREHMFIHGYSLEYIFYLLLLLVCSIPMISEFQILKPQKIEDFNKNLVTAFILMEMQNVMKNCPKIVKQSHFLRMATTNLRHHSAFFVQRKFICLFYVLLDLFSVWAFNWCPVQEIGAMQDYLNCVLSKGFWPRMHFSRKARVQGLTNNLWLGDMSFPLPNINMREAQC